MTHVKEVTTLWHGWGKGNVSVGRWGFGEEVHSCFGIEQLAWCESASYELQQA